MTSMGDVWSDIEWMTRLLDENRAATRGILERQNQLYNRPGDSMKEHKVLKERFNNLRRREREIQSELERLIVIAVLKQINDGRGRPAFENTYKLNHKGSTTCFLLGGQPNPLYPTPLLGDIIPKHPACHAVGS
jgi:hypothetical protein